MSKETDGGPAFSTPFYFPPDPTRSNGYPGMSLRDWFAGQVLVGLVANPKSSGSTGEVARIAYATADGMLRHIAKPEGGAS